ncbi:hypothetical protein ABK040_004529 [Willaertia magna]
MLKTLPDEILLYIFQFLKNQYDLKTISSILRVCKNWNWLLTKNFFKPNHSIWKEFCNENGWTLQYLKHYLKQFLKIEINTKDIHNYSEIYQYSYNYNIPLNTSTVNTSINNLKLPALTTISVHLLPSNHEEEDFNTFNKSNTLQCTFYKDWGSAIKIIYSGYNNNNCEMPDEVKYYCIIKKELIYNEKKNRYSCFCCGDVVKGLALIFIEVFDSGHDWRTLINYKCLNCNRVIKIYTYGGA